ncbi:MAG: acetate--CoA ligase family protein [bacterium]|nr:acetate--CoA ligase family protein [bacterium]
MADKELVEVLSRALVPRAVAVYGASSKNAGEGQGARIVSKLNEFGYRGRVAVINPNPQEVDGTPTIASARDSTLDIDLALIAVPREAVIDALTDCASIGVKLAIVTTAKFAESDQRGVELQEQLVAKARELGVRLIGPNCMGVVNFSDGLVCAGRPLPVRPGRISVVAQSGFLSMRILNYIEESGQGIDLWVTLGNCVDLTPAEMIEYLGQRAETSVVVVYLEQIIDPARMRNAIESARAAGTDVVLLKSGRSALGSATAASHTGALAAPDTFLDVLAEEADAIRVDTVHEAAQVASLIAAFGKRPVGPFVVTSASGGDCVLAADWCTKYDVPLATLSPSTLARVHKITPEASWGNPMDLTPFPFVKDNPLVPVAALVDDPHVGGLILMDGFQFPIETDEDGPRAVLEPLITAGQPPPLPIILDSRVGDGYARLPEWERDQLVSAGMAVTSDAETIWRSLGHIARQARAADNSPASKAEATAAGHAHGNADAPKRLPELEAFNRLREAGVPMVTTEQVTSQHELLEVCQLLTYPVVIKGLIPGIVHKADQQLVHIDIWTDEQALGIWQKLAATVVERGGEIVVQPQLRSVLAEMIVATSDDPHYGPHIMVGGGGRWVEADADVAWATAPVTGERATQLVLRTKIGRALAAKYPSLVTDGDLPKVIAAISRTAADWSDTVSEIEINPLMIQADAVTAVDAVITLRS